MKVTLYFCIVHHWKIYIYLTACQNELRLPKICLPRRRWDNAFNLETSTIEFDTYIFRELQNIIIIFAKILYSSLGSFSYFFEKNKSLSTACRKESSFFAPASEKWVPWWLFYYFLLMWMQFNKITELSLE